MSESLFLRNYVAPRESPIGYNALLRNLRFSFPGVYIFWASNGTALYVGCSFRVLGRARTKTSHANRDAAYKRLHSIEIFRCDSLKQARHLESELIGIYRPKYNWSNVQQYSRTFRQLQAEHEKVFGGRSL